MKNNSMDLNATRRTFLKTVAIGSLAAPFIANRAFGQEGMQVLVTLPDASVEKLVLAKVAPIMKERYKVELKTQQSSSSQVLSAMRVQRRRPTFIAATLDLSFANQALEEDLVEPATVANIPNLKDVMPKALAADGKIVSFILSADTLTFNTKIWSEAPKTYAAIFADDKVALTAFPASGSNIGLEFLAAASAAGSGKPLAEAMTDLEGGIRYLANYRDRIKMIYSRSQEVMPLLANGDVGVCFNKTRFLTDWINRDAPLDCTVPSQGAFYSLNCLVPVKDSPAPELGHAFIDIMLSPEIQDLWAAEIGSAPVNRLVTPNVPEKLKRVVPNAADLEKLVLLPQLTQAHIADLTKMFNSDVAR
ncbi:extracellular solute-binding protein [Rhizobium sp. CG5]|uniref:ABC transporter substrate-binding protein n=1 Tax=Rhizobium sp. CG5 TaxID=2726076 RepID=UPI002033228E|nr:extracellular solute-binding protein [Rhizobium sp. CG5]MCM2477236.1 extracellular solute-binding protein [Rhizobium sp. CG5]